MKYLIPILMIALLSLGCSKEQKKDVANTVDDVTGISTARKAEELKKKIDKAEELDLKRLQDLEEIE